MEDLHNTLLETKELLNSVLSKLSYIREKIFSIFTNAIYNNNDINSILIGDFIEVLLGTVNCIIYNSCHRIFYYTFPQEGWDQIYEDLTTIDCIKEYFKPTGLRTKAIFN